MPLSFVYGFPGILIILHLALPQRLLNTRAEGTQFNCCGLYFVPLRIFLINAMLILKQTCQLLHLINIYEWHNLVCTTDRDTLCWLYVNKLL